MIGILASLAAMASDPVREECAYDLDAMLALDLVAFDQTEGSGWRPLYDARCYVAAAEILGLWSAEHREAFDPTNPLHRTQWRILVWHEAQMWAFAEHAKVALPIFERTYADEDGSSNVAWNFYVDGTIAFLRRDRSALAQAISGLAAVPKPAGWDQAVGADGQPIALPWPQNLNVLEGLERCWDESYSAAYLCRDIPELR